MEGQREEYLASGVPKAIAHIAEVDEYQLDTDEVTLTVEDNTLNNEFAAMSLGVPNDIHFSTYAFAFSSFSEIPNDEHFAFSSISQGFNSALDSACTNHIF